MGVVGIAAKIVLVIVNMLILLLALAMIVIGIIIVAGKDVYNDLLDKVKDKLGEAGTDLGLTLDTSNMSLSDLLLPVAYALIAMGVLMGALSLVGCIGGCYKIKIVLIVYVIVTGCIFVAQVVIVILVYVDKSAFDNTVKPRIKDTLDEFSGIEGTEAKTLAWNAIMNYEECCGVDGYQDFSGLDNWPPTTIGGTSVTLETPVICCKDKTTDYSCAETGTANSTNNWYETGCYDKLYDLITENEIVIIVIAGLMAFQFVLIFCTIWILCTMDNKIDII